MILPVTYSSLHHHYLRWISTSSAYFAAPSAEAILDEREAAEELEGGNDMRVLEG